MDIIIIAIWVIVFAFIMTITFIAVHIGIKDRKKYEELRDQRRKALKQYNYIDLSPDECEGIDFFLTNTDL